MALWDQAHSAKMRLSQGSALLMCKNWFFAILAMRARDPLQVEVQKLRACCDLRCPRGPLRGSAWCMSTTSICNGDVRRFNESLEAIGTIPSVMRNRIPPRYQHQAEVCVLNRLGTNAWSACAVYSQYSETRGFMVCSAER